MLFYSMPSGSFSKHARNTTSIVNRKTCGGNKKAGLSPRATGPVAFRNSALNKQGVNFKLHRSQLPCPETYSNNPGGQCSGGVGSPASTRNRGCRNYGSQGKSCSLREQITLEQAYAQGGVRDCQDLVITEATAYNYEYNEFTYTSKSGLLINNGSTFRIAKTATVSINIEIDNGEAVQSIGIFVTNNSRLINNGTITFSKITSSTYSNGIYVLNGELVNERDGKIYFNDEIKGGNNVLPDNRNNPSCYGMVCEQGLLRNKGMITFYKIAAEFTVGGIGISNRGFIMDGRDSKVINEITGTITFNDELKNISQSPIDIPQLYGIALSSSGESLISRLVNYGKIAFSKLISTKPLNYGACILTFRGNNKIVIENTGLITFNEVELSSIYNDPTGIYIHPLNTNIEVNGQIKFGEGEVSFLPDPARAPEITGSGSITYNNGNETYYPAPE